MYLILPDMLKEIIDWDQKPLGGATPWRHLDELPAQDPQIGKKSV